MVSFESGCWYIEGTVQNLCHALPLGIGMCVTKTDTNILARDQETVGGKDVVNWARAWSGHDDGDEERGEEVNETHFGVQYAVKLILARVSMWWKCGSEGTGSKRE